MADTPETEETTEAPAKKGKLGALMLPAAGLLIGVGGGGFVGAKVIAPKLTAGITSTTSVADLAAAHTKADSAHGEGGDHGDGAKEGEHAAPPPSYVMSDLVLNPAGSGGTRFLMMSVAFEMKDSAAVETLKTRESEIRDALLATIGAQTVEQLSELTGRDPLKADIKRIIGGITKQPTKITRVSFPQFVIQ
jgi:flagellar protein FliL